jgi:L,D-peptidoglycan transpeptidase YkuD (ErfK/YbiS/YcfS/YnhG family)
MAGERRRASAWPVAAAVLVLAASGHAAAAPRASCPASIGGDLAAVGSSSELITVVGTVHSTYASLTLWHAVAGCWVATAGPWTARVGRNGLSGHHQEGDGTTPTGTYGFEPVIYGIAANPGVRYRYHRLVCGDWWDEDPTSPAYNTFRHVGCGTTPPFGGGSEALWQATTAYRFFAALTYNVDPTIPGRGSAIFLHADTGAPTNGCISLPLGELTRVLRWLNPELKPLIVISGRTA